MRRSFEYYYIACLCLVVVITTISILWNQTVLYSSQIVTSFPRSIVHYSDDASTSKPCVIPRLEAYHKSVLDFVNIPEPLNCTKGQKILYRNSNKTWQFNFQYLRDVNLDTNDITCHYQVILRDSGGDDDVTFSTPVPFSPPYYIEEEIYLVTCTDIKSRILFKRAVAQVVPMPRPSTASENFNIAQYDVIIFGVDTISRLNMLRKLPKTYAFLTDVMGGYDFTGYSKMGENTYPNVVAMLTGTSTLDPVNDYENDYKDKIPFIWKKYMELGYRTLYGEDWSTLNLFNLYGRGFRNPPTDHYLRPLYLTKLKVDHFAADFNKTNILMNDQSEYENLFKDPSIWCYGDVPDHMDLVNYHKDFIASYSGHQPLFGFSWITRLGHTDTNKIQVADDDFLEFLTFVKQNNFSKSSFVLFISDHGPRFGDFLQTHYGFYEQRMPVFILVPPDNFKMRFPKTNQVLRENARNYRLVSPYDVYETLLDILMQRFSPTPSEGSPSPSPKTAAPGRSLFQPIPVNRTCKDAGIAGHYCPCYELVDVPIHDPVVKKISSFIVSIVNAAVTHLRGECALLYYKKTVFASKRKLITGTKDLGNSMEVNNYLNTLSELSYHRDVTADQSRDGEYRVFVEVTPSNATYEASVKYYQADATMELLGPVSRTNMYKNQSFCVDNAILKLYCFCRYFLVNEL